ncbi:MAG: hypothetical protein R2751_19515 [Bacteroidales bacterium]
MELEDGQLKARWFGRDGWAQYIYALDSGVHVLRWTSTGSGAGLASVAIRRDTVGRTSGVRSGRHHFLCGFHGRHGLIAARDDGRYDGKRKSPGDAGA